MLTHVFVNASFPRDFFIVAAFIAPTRSSLFALIYVYIVYVIVLDKKENVVLLSIWTASLCSNCQTLRAVLNALHKWQDSALNFVMHLKYTQFSLAHFYPPLLAELPMPPDGCHLGGRRGGCRTLQLAAVPCKRYPQSPLWCQSDL